MQLFEAFTPTSYQTWLEQITKDLKGKPLTALDWQIEPQLSASAIAAAETMPALQGEDFSLRRGSVFNQMDTGWQVVEEICVDDAQALSLIQKSDAQAFLLYSHQTSPSAEAFIKVIEGIDHAQFAVHIHWEGDIEVFWAAFTQYISGLADAQSFTGTFTGLQWHLAKTETYHRIAAFTQQHLPYFRPFTLALHNVQTSIVSQISLALHLLVDWVEIFCQNGKTATEALSLTGFVFPVAGDFFPEIAKFRAFRMLFGRICEIYGIQATAAYSPFIVAQTASINKSRYDAYTNMLRTTTEAMSAAIGGAHAVCVCGYNATFAQPDGFSLRIARNVQHLLKHESHLDKVADAAGGAYYVESLTDTLAQTAWKAFQQWEAQGTYSQNQAQGKIQAHLEALHTALLEKIRKRKKVLVGVNQYPDTTEWMHTTGDFSNEKGIAFEFEQLRAQTDAYSVQTGLRPYVLLYLFGEVNMRTARALFSRNLLGCGGFDILENEVPTHPPVGVVLCSSDSEYLSEGKQLMATLRNQYPQAELLIAGKPEGIEALGADACFFAGIDAIAFLEARQAKWLKN